MQALQTVEWYKEHPKPFTRNGRNLDQELCRTGLRLSKTQYRTLSQSILAAIAEDNISLDKPSGLRDGETKDRVKAVLKTLASNVGPQYGWSEIDEIDKNIIPDYMFEIAKRSTNNQKRKMKVRAPSESDIPAASGALPGSRCEAPLLSQPQHKELTQDGLRSPQTIRHGLDTPVLSGASTPLLNTSVGQGHSLHTCNIYVTQADTGLDYEDTIDTFLKADSRSSRGNAEFGPSDYDFTIFKLQLTEVLLYDQESDMIYYSHAQKGEVEVDFDWKWRVALKYLASQPGAQGTLNFGIRRRGEHRRLGGHNSGETSANTAMLPSMSQATRQSELSPPPPSPPPVLAAGSGTLRSTLHRSPRPSSATQQQPVENPL
jgi:hypothetical protein